MAINEIFAGYQSQHKDIKYSQALRSDIHAFIHHCQYEKVMSGTDNIDPHMHDYIEFVYVLEGTAKYTSDEAHFTIKPGNYFISDYNNVHKYDFINKKDFKIINILFKPFFIDASLYNAKRMEDITRTHLIKYNLVSSENKLTTSVFFDTDGEIKRYSSLILDDLSSHKPNFELIRCYLLILIIKLLQNTQNIIKEETTPQITEITKYIQKNYYNQITLSEICKTMNYSLSYISTLFHNETKMTFRDYLKKTRINQACNLLKNTKMKIYEISEAVGYNDIHKFQQNFKELIGTTPRDYRKP